MFFGLILESGMLKTHSFSIRVAP